MIAKSKETSVASIAGVLLAALAAASNPQAAVGVALLGGSIQQDQMLSFSRDAERESDRVGFDMLVQAGFEPAGMLAFFNRLQQANRLVDVGLPVYLRSHPMTSERISDVQARLALMRYRQRSDSVDFALVRAKLRCFVPLPGNVIKGNPSLLNEEHRRTSLSYFERQVGDKELSLKADAWYGLALAKRMMKDYAGARLALAQARKRLNAPSVFVEHDAAALELEAGHLKEAQSLVETSLKQFNSPRSLVHLKAKVLMQADLAQAQQYLEEQVRIYRGDHVLWNTLSELHFKQQQDLAGHRSRSEAYASLGMWLPAMEQLRIAQRYVNNDYYNGSQIDARLKEFERNYLQDQTLR